MLNEITSVLKKRIKMLALMMGVASAPLARAQYVFPEGENAVKKTSPKEELSFPKNKDAIDLEALIREADKEFEDMPKTNNLQEIKYIDGVCKASVDEVTGLLDELSKMPNPTDDVSRISHAISPEEYNKKENNKKDAKVGLQPEEVAAFIVESMLEEPKTNRVQNVSVVESTQKPVETAPVEVVKVPKLEEKPVITAEPVEQKPIETKTEEKPVITMESTPTNDQSVVQEPVKVAEAPKVEEKSVTPEEPILKTEENVAEKTVETLPSEVSDQPKIEEKSVAKNETMPIADERKPLVFEPEPAKEPEKNKSEMMILGILGLLGGAFWGGRWLKRKRQEATDKENDEFLKNIAYVLGNNGVKGPIPPKMSDPFKMKDSPKVEKKKIVPRKNISLDWNELSQGKSDAQLHQEGIRMLGINKVQRAALRQQKKALMAELITANAERKIQIEALLEENAIRGKELSLERRQACIKIRGKQGEEERQQRRLYAKQKAQLRRLSKKDGLDRSAEMKKLDEACLAIKETNKKAIDIAKKEADDRAQEASYKHGLRLLHEVEEEQKELDSFYYAVKKETGLKRKKDILATDDYLQGRQKKTTQKKRQALKLVKGRKFTREKIRLGKLLKAALVENDTFVAEKISDQFKDVQAAQKECVQNAKDFNYDEGRLDLINQMTAQRIRKHREAVRVKRERLKKARKLRGLRMLYYLYKNQSPAVNNNQITNKDYYQEAVGLLGDSAKTVKVADYPKQRCTHLKDITVANIYRRRKQMERT